MRMLFEDIAKNHFSIERIRKHTAWIENAEKARELGSLGSRDDRYDKAEELITFYTFAPHLKIWHCSESGLIMSPFTCM